MRFAEPLRVLCLSAALCTALAGCARMSPSPQAQPLGRAVPASVSAPGSSREAVTASATDAPVSAAAQRTYDEARRALAAGRMDLAERGFRELARAHPEWGGPHANLGLILRQAGKLPEAVSELELAVAANPRQAVYFNQLGITYRQQGQFTKAREAYERAIDIDAAYTSPLLNLGILHDLYLGDGKAALELYNRYLALVPGGDPVVAKWIADLKNRKPPSATASPKEKP